MKRFTLSVLLITFSVAAVANEPLREDRCFALIQNDLGNVQRLELANFSVLAQTNAAAEFSLPAEVTTKPAGILCVRSSVVPAANDYKVVVAGVPFNISTDEPEGIRRVIVLELSGGQFRARLLKGELLDSEGQAIGQRLNQFQAATRVSSE
jgi:hypothetical protein